MGRIVFSSASRVDRRAITSYTVRRFGPQQARRLRDRFARTLTLLAESPEIGRSMPELDPPDHAFRYVTVANTFIVVYEAVDDGIRVARLLHGARDLAAELGRDPGDER